jgi:XRE family transcriptional regulator, regulator of sulfur utilization
MSAYYLRRLRQDRRLTLEALSYLTRLSPAAISMIERGERSPTPETVVALARGLGVSAKRLARELAEPAPEPAKDGAA